MNVEAVEQTYWRNPILRYTQHPLHSPLLPLPYGDVSIHCECRPTLYPSVRFPLKKDGNAVKRASEGENSIRREMTGLKEIKLERTT